MNRELLCQKCGEKAKKELAEPVLSSPLAQTKQFIFLEGKIKANFLACDRCEKDFKRGDWAEALSTWTGKSDYKPWEKTYIEIA